MRFSVGAVAACLVVGCATTGTGGGTGMPERPAGAAWFAVKAACPDTLAAVGAAAQKPDGSPPDPHRQAEYPAWCAYAPDDLHPSRADSTAQRVSTALRVPVVSFYVTEAAWSYTIFVNGTSVFAQEAHYGPPQVIGDAARAAEVVGVSAGALLATVSEAKNPAAAESFATQIGTPMPDPSAPRVTLVGVPVAPLTHEAPPPKLLPGAWAVIPPLGVVLVKTIEGAGDAEVYVLVDDASTLKVPVARSGGLGLRRLSTEAEAAAALKLVADGVEVTAGDYDSAQVKGWLDTLKSGALAKIAHTYGEICAIQEQRKLYQLESGLLDTARDWLTEEIGAIQGEPHDVLDAALRDDCD